ncbi:molybdenum cofactor guanylyltransferase [Phycicoccus avicenniae]|uniref:molybdenum cofactor guanylyltransferase n=1 Tax=Phycicoccus avicenniae TaxID=2828860 RepID=UPI003D2C02D1
MAEVRGWDERTDVTAVVLVGGRSRRFGSDKLAAPLDGTSVLDRLLADLPASWPLVLVGPRRDTVRDDGVWTVEDPPGGGPLAAVAAGLAEVDTDLTAVLAGDMPYAAEALPLLLAALGTRSEEPAVAAVAVDEADRANPLLAVYHRAAVAHVVTGVAAGEPARRLLELPHRRVRVAGAAARDIDTRADLDDLTGPR